METKSVSTNHSKKKKFSPVVRVDLEERIKRYFQIKASVEPLIFEIADSYWVHWQFNRSDNQEEAIYIWEQFHEADVKVRKKLKREQIHEHPFYSKNKCKICKRYKI